MPIFRLGASAPRFEDRSTNWIASDATLVGKVRIGRNATIWFGAVVRGDNEEIIVGPRTSVQEHTVMHTDLGFPLIIGQGCTIGHRAVLHGCTIGDNSLIGIGAVVLNGARIGNNCLVGASALVTEGKEFPDNSLIVGSPARIVRTLDPAEVEKLRESARHYVENGARYFAELSEA